jgi:hypothetical protein
VIRDFTLCDEYTAGMDGKVVGIFFDHVTIAEDVFRIGMMFAVRQRFVDDSIDVGFGESLLLFLIHG